jgi:pimeloyl-ACP methyl ester carboxylesterase
MVETKNFQSKLTEVQGIKLHYLEWGEVGKPDLLLVHGWTGFALSWSTVAEYFQERLHIIAPDLRGHGDSDKPQTGESSGLVLRLVRGACT